MQKLERLPYKTNQYEYKDGQLSRKEEPDGVYILNLSGGRSIREIHGLIKTLRPKHYKILDFPVGGDAPKDFISVYEYKKGESPNKQWQRHIAKIGHKWYPLESISEYLLNRIGEVLGLCMAEAQLRLADEQIRFLSKYFLQADEIMMHGAQIYSSYLLQNDTKLVDEIERRNLTRKLFSFQFTNEAIEFVFPKEHENIMTALVELLVFDAITGNNDRHFYNWAIITDLKGRKIPTFSPIYDSARGLFWNISESTIERKFYEKGNIKTPRLETYIQSSRPKIGWKNWKGKAEINHLQLIENIYKAYPIHRKTCEKLLKPVALQSILHLIDAEFKLFFSNNRYRLIVACLKKRFEHLTNVCKT